MRHKFGIVCMFLGALLLLSAMLLLIYNENESQTAHESAVSLMPQIVDEIMVQREEASKATQESEASFPTEQHSTEMLAVEIDGYEYIGYLTIPDLQLELPVMESWDYDKLKYAPCRYTGSVWSDDLVIMAHNFEWHFGKISKLTEGDMVSFVDMEGNVFCYEVVVKDVLAPDAIEEMTAGDFDLTLFTCTYGGAQRVTVYCNEIR